MRVVEHRAVRSLYVILTLVIVLAGDAVRFTMGWVAFSIVAGVLGIWSIVVLVVRRRSWHPTSLPLPLLAFLLLATASLAWSFYPAATALGLATTWFIVIAAVAIAMTTRWNELLRHLGVVLRWIIALSLVFELFVATVIRGPILPLFVQPGVNYADHEKIPRMLYWSRNELFEVFDDGRIQGIVGNANNLGMLALLSIIVFGIQFADRKVSRIAGITWIALAALTLVFARSATVTVAVVALVALVAAVLAVRRTTPGRSRAIVYAFIAAIVAAGVALSAAFATTILALLGKSEDLTGRFEVWGKVIALAQERPAFGWGWVSFWVPWAQPFTDLAYRNDVRLLQAHNVWLDLWLQLGIVGAVVFAALVVSTVVRAWTKAIDPPTASPGGNAPFDATAMLPLLIIGVLLVQSFAESRLIVEFGIFFLAAIAVKTKLLDDPLETESARRSG